MVQVSTCGWLLSVLRAPYSSGVYPQQIINSRSNYSIETSCKILIDIGFDSYLGDLLYIVSESSVDNVVEQLQLPNFSSKIRAKSQLTQLLKVFTQFIRIKGISSSCLIGGLYVQSNCSTS